MSGTDTPFIIEAKAALSRLVRHTLEVMCFADAELLPAGTMLNEALTARAAFAGSYTGFLQLETEPATARALASACLGFEPPDAGDTMQELAAVVCGRVVTALNPTGQFQIQQCELTSTSKGAVQIVQQAFDLGFGALHITLQLS